MKNKNEAGYITDPELIAQLNAAKQGGSQPSSDQQSQQGYIQDPELIKQLQYQSGPHPDVLKSTGLGLAQLYNTTVPETAKGYESLAHLARAFLPSSGLYPLESKIINKIPNIENVAEKIPEFNIEDIRQKWGRTGKETIADEAIQGLLKHLPEVYGGIRAAKAIPFTVKSAYKPFKKAEPLIKDRGLGTNIPVNANHIKLAKKILPKTEEVKDMIKDAQKGNYNAIIDLQSSVGHEARKLKKSPLRAESRQAPVASELKSNILKNLYNHFDKSGSEDIADLIAQGMNRSRIYYKMKEKLYPQLKKAGIPLSLSALGYAGYKGAKKALD